MIDAGPATARRLMALIGGLQGLALWLLYESWPEESPKLAAGFVAAVFFIATSGLVIHMARSGRDRLRLVGLAAATGAVFAAVALWVGWQLPPEGVGFAGDEKRVPTWVVGSGIALYALGPFLQIHQLSGRLLFPYPQLYRHSWNNFFIAFLGGTYTAALWVVLVLWARLFGLIGIDLFEELFEETSFVYIATGAALGYGLAAGRENARVIETLRGLTQALFRALLPLLGAVTLGFLASLPFTGVEPLFQTRSAATILINWLAIYTLLLNAVYLDGTAAPPYRVPLRCLVEASALAMPALGGIAIYALGLRIEQYGLTPDRVFAVVFALVLTAYAAGYALAVLLRGDPWLPGVRRVNLGLAWVVIALALALHTPLLDPLALSLRSQLERLASTDLDRLGFDFGFLRFHLGREGHVALRVIQAGTPEPEALRERIELALAAENYHQWKRGAGVRLTASELERLPRGSPWPLGLREAIEQEAGDWPVSQCHRGSTCVVLPFDLDGDGEVEELLAVVGGRRGEIVAFRLGEEGWRRVAHFAARGCCEGAEARRWLAELRAGRLAVVPPEFGDLELGGWRLHHRAP